MSKDPILTAIAAKLLSKELTHLQYNFPWNDYCCVLWFPLFPWEKWRKQKQFHPLQLKYRKRDILFFACWLNLWFSRFNYKEIYCAVNFIRFNLFRSYYCPVLVGCYVFSLIFVIFFYLDSVTVIDKEYRTGGLSSYSGLVFCIHFRTDAIWKCMSSHPSYALNSRVD